MSYACGIYNIVCSLNERTIYMKIIDSQNYFCYEGNFDVKEFKLSLALDSIYTLLCKCFANETDYHVKMSVNTGIMKLCFDALVGGFMKVETEILIREKLMSNDGQLTMNFNKLEQGIRDANVKLEKITEKVLYQFKNTKLTIDAVVTQFALCASMGGLNNYSYQLFLDTIINNVYGISTIDYEIRFSDDFMRLLTQFKTENVTNLDQFVKFILINQFHSQVWSIETRINTYLSYKNRGEIPLSSYMYAVCDIENAIRHNYSIVINWKPDDGLDELDQFYLRQLSNL